LQVDDDFNRGHNADDDEDSFSLLDMLDEEIENEERREKAQKRDEYEADAQPWECSNLPQMQSYTPSPVHTTPSAPISESLTPLQANLSNAEVCQEPKQL
jgi:hypothetical protein